MGRLNRPPPPRQPAPDTITQRFTYFPARQAHLLKPTILQRRTRALGRVHTATTAVPVRRPTKWREWRRPWTRALTRITPFLPPDRGWIRKGSIGIVLQVLSWASARPIVSQPL